MWQWKEHQRTVTNWEGLSVPGHCWLPRWRKGPHVQECRWHLGFGKGKETDSRLKPPERKQPYWYLDFSPGRPRQTERQYTGVAKAMNCVVTCYSGSGKLIVMREKHEKMLQIKGDWGGVTPPNNVPLGWILSQKMYISWAVENSAWDL